VVVVVSLKKWGLAYTVKGMNKMSKTTEHGFKFGSLDITRTALNDKTGVAVVSIKTSNASFSVRATKTGRMRIYDEHGNECEIVNKDFMKGLPWITS
jgi:hypothetical protein